MRAGLLVSPNVIAAFPIPGFNKTDVENKFINDPNVYDNNSVQCGFVVPLILILVYGILW